MAEVHGHGGGLQRWNPLAEAERNVRAYQPGVHMADSRPQDRLEKRENGAKHSQGAKSSEARSGATAPAPAWRCDHRQSGHQREKEERQSQMRRRHGIRKLHQNRESPEEALDQQEYDSSHRPPTNRWAPGFGFPGHVSGSGEDQNEAPGDEAVQVLPENAPRHFGEHRPKTGGPIGAGQARSRCVDDAAQEQQPEGPPRRDVKCSIMLFRIHA